MRHAVWLKHLRTTYLDVYLLFDYTAIELAGTCTVAYSVIFDDAAVWWLHSATITEFL